MHGTALAAAVAPAALVAAVAVGYILGKRGGRQRPRSAPTTQCACGASLHGFSDNARERHYASARHRRNIRLIARCAKIVVAENWGEYRNAIAHCVRETDTVLEVGCGNGVTTSLLSQTAARAVGVDLSAPLIDEARRRFPSLEWHSMDARRAGDLAKLARFDAIFVDLNGSRELETLCPLIDAYEATMRPSVIVVKSNKLKHLVSKCNSVEALIRDGGPRGGGGPEPASTATGPACRPRRYRRGS